VEFTYYDQLRGLDLGNHNEIRKIEDFHQALRWIHSQISITDSDRTRICQFFHLAGSEEFHELLLRSGDFLLFRNVVSTTIYLFRVLPSDDPEVCMQKSRTLYRYLKYWVDSGIRNRDFLISARLHTSEIHYHPLI